MKRIYLLMIVFVALASSTFAQRKIDISFTTRISKEAGLLSIMKAGDSIYVNNDADHPFKPDYAWSYQFYLTNLTTDTLVADDTVKLRTGFGYRVNGNLATVQGIGKKDTVYLPVPVSSAPSPRQSYSVGDFTPPFSASGVQDYNWCDSIHVVDKNSKVVTDDDMNNDKQCKTIKLVTWYTSVGNVETAPNEMVLFPNPASNSVDIMYTFAKTAKNVKVVVTNLAGQVVASNNYEGNFSGTQTFSIDVSKLSYGVHFVNMTADNGVTFTERLNVVK